MKKKPLICILLFIGLAACKNNDDALRFKALNEGLKRYGNIIKNNNERIDYELKNELQDPRTASKAAIWQPKAAYIKTLTDSMTGYIEALQAELKKEAGPGENDQEPGNNSDAVNTVFQKHGGPGALYHKLMVYNEKVLSVLNPDEFADNPLLMADIKKEKEAFRQQFPLNKETPVIAYFENTGAATAITMLSKLQNDVAITAHELLEYYNCQITIHGHYDTEFFPIIGQNTNYLKPGQLLEIHAGMGEFNIASRPKINIDGRLVALNAEGLAEYKITVAGKPGKYSIPVKISYVKPDGSLSSYSRKIEYTVEK